MVSSKKSEKTDYGFQGRIAHYILLGIIFGLGFLLIYMLKPYFSAIFGGFILAFLFNPLFKKLNVKIKKPKLSAIITMFIALIIVIVPLLFLSGVLISQGTSVVNNLDNFDTYIQKINDLGPWDIQTDALEKLSSNSISYITSKIPAVISQISSFVLSMFISFFLMYYLLLHKVQIYDFFKNHLPLKPKASEYLLSNSRQLIKAMLIGQGVIALLQGTLGGLGFLIFGIDGAFFWGFVMAVTSVIPMVGTAIVWAPAAIFLLLDQNYTGGIGLILWGILVIGTSDNIVRPKLVNKLSDIHPVWVLLGVIIGLSYLGLMGLIVGPLLISLFFVLIKAYSAETKELK
ncbi:AI-2E family transporter [Candidatus Woesearchaeota archaeon]|jgi:predicted PurR-regulated permease PerM|nr:AI-2E family transporter [Candidatus Woesearchaeota archaeon]